MNWKSEIKKKDSVRRIEPAISPDYMPELRDINNYISSILDKKLTNEQLAAFPEEDKKTFRKQKNFLTMRLNCSMIYKSVKKVGK